MMMMMRGVIAAVPVAMAVIMGFGIGFRAKPFLHVQALGAGIVQAEAENVGCGNTTERGIDCDGARIEVG